MSEPIPDWWAEVQRGYDVKGFVVIASPYCLPLGYVVNVCWVPGMDGNRDRTFPQPFAVVGESSREEFLAQSRFHGWPEPHDLPLHAHFYRIATD